MSSSSSSACSSTCQPLGTPWSALKAVTSTQATSTVIFTYSWIQAGTMANDAGSSGSQTCVELKDHVDNSVSNSDFKQEIREALQVWKEAFESLYPNLTLIFSEIGDESGQVPASDANAGDYSIGSGGSYPSVGDLRFGMHNIDGASNALAHAYEPGGTLGVIGNVGGDLHFDSSENWRKDSDSVTSNQGALSVKYIAVHEIGHIFGLGHSSSTNSVMYSGAAASWVFDDIFPNGLSLEDLQCIRCVYGNSYNSSSSSPSPQSSPSASLSSSSSQTQNNSSTSSSSSSSSTASLVSSLCCQPTDTWAWGDSFPKGITVKHNIPVIIGGTP